MHTYASAQLASAFVFFGQPSINKIFGPVHQPSSFCSIAPRRYLATNFPSIDKSRRFMTKESWQEIDSIEKHVYATAQSKLDLNRLVNALDRENEPKVVSDLSDPKDVDALTSPSTIAVTAGLVTSIVSFYLFHNAILSIGLFVVAWLAAIDPLKNDSLVGVVARIMGRSVLESVTVVQPKLKAVARAAVTEEDEIALLTKKLREAEQEIRELRLWKQTREKLDSISSRISLEDLKDLARRNKLTTSGSKNDLLMRLIDAEVIEL
jgi:hypothetical protein